MRFTYLVKSNGNVQCGFIKAPTRELAEERLRNVFNDMEFYSVTIL